jgi:hypothetical protein
MPTLHAGRPSRPGKSAGGFPTTAYGSSTSTGGIQLVPTAQTQTQQQLPIATSGDELEDATQNPQIPTTAGPAFQFVDNTPGWKKFLLGVGGVATPNVGMLNAQLALAHQAQQEQQAFEMQRLAAAGDIQRRNELDRVRALGNNETTAQQKRFDLAQAGVNADDVRLSNTLNPTTAQLSWMDSQGLDPSNDTARAATVRYFQALADSNMKRDALIAQNRAAIAASKGLTTADFDATSPNARVELEAELRKKAEQSDVDFNNAALIHAAQVNPNHPQFANVTDSVVKGFAAKQLEPLVRNNATNIHVLGKDTDAFNFPPEGSPSIIGKGRTTVTTAINPVTGKLDRIPVDLPASAVDSAHIGAIMKAFESAQKEPVKTSVSTNAPVTTATVDASTLVPNLALTQEQKNELPPLYESDNSALSKHNMAMSDLMRYARGGVALNPESYQQDWVPGQADYHPFTPAERLDVNKRIAEMLAKGRKLRGIPSTATQVK